MTGLFRSKSCGLVGLTEFKRAPPSPFFYKTKTNYTAEELEEEFEEELEGEFEEADDEEYGSDGNSIATTPFMSPTSRFDNSSQGGRNSNSTSRDKHSPLRDILAALFRKSLVTCSVDIDDVCSLDISAPTGIKHVSHVTFDRFNGFLGLPTELQPDVPKRVPSASASVFGVSAQSMQCSYDDRGNSVPTILLMIQKRLYAEGGLKEEGIFRINAENSQEEHVRYKLNKGVVPRGIDGHCLAGLIKAWFRELPTGVLDSLTPEQVMHCNTEKDCTDLVNLLPTMEAALLDWAINLMADVVRNEQYNKMNARNIAMVFAPNMTQMADPLTALIHAVQVMNFLKTLILKTLREREESAAKERLMRSCSGSPTGITDIYSAIKNSKASLEQEAQDACQSTEPATAEFLKAATLSRLECGPEEKLWSFHNSDAEEEFETPNTSEAQTVENEVCKGGYHNEDRPSLRRRLCRHPVFQLSKSAKKTRNIRIVNSRGREAWA